MARYQIILAYDGTDFNGFQRQATGSQNRTVQGVVEDALRRLKWPGGKLLAAGRTDSGVHAHGQVIAFDLDWAHPPLALQAALNANLPLDVAIQAVHPVADDFHPRYDALSRCYRYQIYCQPVRDPLRDRYAWRVWPALQVDRLERAAAYLPGTHDFAAFGTPPRAGSSTVRNVLRAEWRYSQEELSFEIEANAFLFHMVRRLVGFQVAIGQGMADVERLVEALQGGPCPVVQYLAPPQGLTLLRAVYSNDPT
jgi:tRNA pseudouridine38-40 synthase